MSVLDHMKTTLINRAKALIIGIPSTEGLKATGLKYSTEYFQKESANQSRSDFHRLNARVGYLVLSDPRLESFIMETLVPEIVDAVLADGFAVSGLKNEENEQAKNDAAVTNGTKAVKKAAKAAPKAAAKKTTAKKATATATKKPVAKKAPARRTTRTAK